MAIGDKEYKLWILSDSNKDCGLFHLLFEIECFVETEFTTTPKALRWREFMKDMNRCKSLAGG